MMNDSLIEKELLKELKGLENEKSILPTQVDVYKNAFADKLVYGKLGDEIKNTLKNPVKISRWQIFIMKYKNFINRLMEIL